MPEVSEVSWPEAANHLTPAATKILAALRELVDEQGFALSIHTADVVALAGPMVPGTVSKAMQLLVATGEIARRRTRERPVSYDYHLSV